MVLCELAPTDNFLLNWLVMSVASLVFLVVAASGLFVRYYVRPVFSDWRWKTCATYPECKAVRGEIVQMTKGMLAAALPPAISLHWARQPGGNHPSQAYCGWGPVGDPPTSWRHGLPYLLVTFFVCWIVSDFFEWAYHRWGHQTSWGWQQHKHHHAFYNPTPFATVADDYLDQFVRASPLLWLPILLPVNMDMLLVLFGVVFYAFGLYQHWGFELSWPTAHQRFITTSFHHHAHHARASRGRPLHSGQLLQVWDRLCGSVLDRADCFCAPCAVAKGERTRAAFQALPKPDYAPLLRWQTWWHGL